MGSQTGARTGGNLKEQLDLDRGIAAPVAVAASGGLLTVDRKGFNTVLFALTSGAVVGAGSVTPKIQHSATDVDGDFIDVTTALQGWGDKDGAAIGATDLLRQLSVDCRQLERYVRVYLTLTGTSIVIGCLAIKGAAEVEPTA